ncbi:class F sortase [Candidatus Saccharibacteria bacterium]|nr:class F sortase [Candidatus Saccharibacteria bacterium]MCL1962668.1 class F sortase [Candidatus Saccharibacteria bacterium]
MVKKRLKLKPAKKSGGIFSKMVTVLLSILLFCGFVVCSFLLIRFFTSDDRPNDDGIDATEVLNLDTKEVTEEDKDEYTVAPNRPRYLFMPSIGVERARVKEIGLKQPNAQGFQQMEAPSNIYDVGWYNCQKNPVVAQRCLAEPGGEPVVPGGGDMENAVIMDGHTCFSKTFVCIFDNLSNLKAGDTATVQLGDGTKINYVVKKVEIKNLDDVDMVALSHPIESGKEGMNLITCIGRYNGATDANGALTASQRVLVWTVRE